MPTDPPVAEPPAALPPVALLVLGPETALESEDDPELELDPLVELEEVGAGDGAGGVVVPVAKAEETASRPPRAAQIAVDDFMMIPVDSVTPKEPEG